MSLSARAKLPDPLVVAGQQWEMLSSDGIWVPLIVEDVNAGRVMLWSEREREHHHSTVEHMLQTKDRYRRPPPL